MTQQEVIKKTKDYVRGVMTGNEGGHDWWHAFRVWENSLLIGKHEKADMFVVQLAALLHDIDDWKFNGGDLDAGPKKAKVWLRKMKVDSKVIGHVCEIIKESEFKGTAGAFKGMRTIEGMIVQDADRLDALGAIGIARTFSFGGFHHREIHNPNTRPNLKQNEKQFLNDKSTTVNHFYEKLLLVRDLMNTKTAKKIATERHKYMKDFLKRFFAEWDGKK